MQRYGFHILRAIFLLDFFSLEHLDAYRKYRDILWRLHQNITYKGIIFLLKIIILVLEKLHREIMLKL